MVFTLIIPTCRRADALRDCLTAVFQSDFPQENYEVIVIIDGKCSESFKVTDSFKTRYTNLVVLNQIPTQGPAAARNTGIRMARGEIIAFTDDDCLVDVKWIRKMIETHQKYPDIAAVGGDTLVPGKSVKRIIGQYLTNMNINYPVKNKMETIFFPTCNVSLKKSILNRFGFNAQFPLPGGEDLEYFWRLFKKGYRFIYDETIIVHHYRSPGLKSFIRQNYYYGRGNMLVFKIHPDHPALPTLTLNSPAFFLGLIKGLFNAYEHAYWNKLSKNMINLYCLSGKMVKLKVDFFLSVARFFYMLGRIREFFALKYFKSYQVYYKETTYENR